MGLEHSRAVRLAAGAADAEESELKRALEASRIVVSADASLPQALLTTTVLVTTLRRLPGQLVLERGELSRTAVDELVASVAAIDQTVR